MRNIIFIAPPAAGKGSVSDYLVKSFGYTHISTGDLLREEIKSGSELGKEIDELISSGNFVSDEVIIKMVSSKLDALKDKLFILDGFPRTLVQAHKLDEMFENNDVSNVIAIYLDINIEEATKRVLGRMICPKCKKSYHKFNKEFVPKVENICDICGVELEHRSDDNEETFKARFDAYIKNTSPIIDFYRDKGILYEVNAMQTAQNMFNDVVECANDKEAQND